MSRYQWAEDDFLPDGVTRLTTEEPQNGRTYVMYHGTTRDCADSICEDGFQRSADGMLGPGVYLSRDLEKARRYPIDLEDDENRVIIKVKVNVGRVIAIRYKNHRLQRTWSSYGYDTAWVPPNCGMVKSGLEENCVWDPRRIKVIRLISPQLLTSSPSSSPTSSPTSSPPSSQASSPSSSSASSQGSSQASSAASSAASSSASSPASSSASSRASSPSSSSASS